MGKVSAVLALVVACHSSSSATQPADATASIDAATDAPVDAPSACLDECNLGDTMGSATCQLWSVATRSPVDAGSGTSDRARLYNAYLRDHGMPAGQVAYVEYAAADLQTIAGYGDQGDAAIFTGTYLAAEALRYKATHSPDALANVTAIVKTLHLAWNVAGAGSPGYLVRFVAPTTSSPTVLSSFDTANTDDHFNTTYAGQTYDWKGHISRDQYQGVVLGYSLAYDVLVDESVRDLIRADMTTFVTELMKTRTLYPTIDGVVSVIPFSVQYCVITDQEPLNISLSGDADTLTGMQEFMPKLLGLYPEPTVAIQLASIFEVALQVTQGQTAWASQYATIQAFFTANVDSWLDVAKGWTYNRNCGTSYFANNIAFEPMYDLARLEQDPARAALIRQTIPRGLDVAAGRDERQELVVRLHLRGERAGEQLARARGDRDGKHASRAVRRAASRPRGRVEQRAGRSKMPGPGARCDRCRAAHRQRLRLAARRVDARRCRQPDRGLSRRRLSRGVLARPRARLSHPTTIRPRARAGYSDLIIATK